jgi:protein SMG6
MKSPTLPEAEAELQTGGVHEDSNDDGIPEHPPAFKFAVQLVFQMLSSVLQPSQFAQSTLNMYPTIILTFVATADWWSS